MIDLKDNRTGLLDTKSGRKPRRDGQCVRLDVKDVSSVCANERKRHIYKYIYISLSSEPAAATFLPT